MKVNQVGSGLRAMELVGAWVYSVFEYFAEYIQVQKLKNKHTDTNPHPPHH